MERPWPKYRIAILNDEGEWEHAKDADGEPRWKVCKDPERAIQAAIREAIECSTAEPERHFAVLGPDDEVVAEFEPAEVAECPF